MGKRWAGVGELANGNFGGGKAKIE